MAHRKIILTKTECPFCGIPVKEGEDIPVVVRGQLVLIRILNGPAVDWLKPSKQLAHKECIIECLGLL